MSRTIIAIPVMQSRMFGWPGWVSLTKAECRAMELIHLGGMEALRNNGGKPIACSTVGAMVRNGLLGRDGPTPLGEYIGRELVQTSLESLRC